MGSSDIRNSYGQSNDTGSLHPPNDDRIPRPGFLECKAKSESNDQNRTPDLNQKDDTTVCRIA